MTTHLKIKSSILLKMPLKKLRFWFVGMLVVTLIWLMTTYGVTLVRVSGDSMNPTLQDGQILFLQPLAKTYQHGDIVVLKPPKELQTRASRFVKRMIALPGDSLSIREGIVYLNDQVFVEPYVTQHSSRPENFPEVVVSQGEVIAFEGFALAELPSYLQNTLAMLEPLPEEVLEQSQQETVTYVGTIRLKKGFYFVLGDNREFSASEDSRLFGAIRAVSIQGIARPF
jgi:signal peptidase I